APATPIVDACTASATGRIAVNGGATTISTSWTASASFRNSLMNATASWTVLYIFQLAAINGVRLMASGLRSVRQRGNARQHAPPEEFERRAPAGGDMCDFIADVGLADRRDGIAAADHSRALDVRHRFRDRHGSSRERLDFKHPHRAVPHHRLRRTDDGPICLDCSWSDVQTHAGADGRVGHGNRLGRRARFELRRDYVIDGQLEP